MSVLLGTHDCTHQTIQKKIFEDKAKMKISTTATKNSGYKTTETEMSNSNRINIS